jgi:hypothetical protein
MHLSNPELESFQENRLELYEFMWNHSLLGISLDNRFIKELKICVDVNRFPKILRKLHM